MRIGILFGGRSREREISFAGGRTVYDLLDKSIFTPVPIFVDSLGNFILLDWQYLYKGSIRDFYPPTQYLRNKHAGYQAYIESLNPSTEELDKIISEVGKKVEGSDLKNLIDFAFLTLHGPYGEDGSIQGLLSFYDIPYSGSGIYPSAIGIDKALQKDLFRLAGIRSAKSFTIDRKTWLESDREEFISKTRQEIKYPAVIKSANQGSSIGVSILKSEDKLQFYNAVNKSLYIREISDYEWTSKSDSEKKAFVTELSDIYEGVGIPFRVDNTDVFHPSELYSLLEKTFSKGEKSIRIESHNTEPKVIIEEFIEGKEFSCIVIENADGSPLALPPTEIIKSSSIFDYRAKYLPGISRKVTPINLDEETIRKISLACEELYKLLKFDVYARIDGIIKSDGSIYLNDPNTTSGMLPSSFFFHQAAEIGLSPGQFLTYIIHKSLEKRSADAFHGFRMGKLLQQLNAKLDDKKQHITEKETIVVIFGGNSTERHISVESGRNVFEKISSSGKYNTIPVFLDYTDNNFSFYQLPLNLLLKDNADDIREKSKSYHQSPVIREIVEKAANITARFASPDYKFNPEEITLNDISSTADFVFLGLHGRPGEDGTIQRLLESVSLPYNGSGPDSSAITIDKYKTNNILEVNGLKVPKHYLVEKQIWLTNPNEVFQNIESNLGYPLIAKPSDDGCSSAVKKIFSRSDLEIYTESIFREINSGEGFRDKLGLKPNEEFPCKTYFVVEEMVQTNGASHFLEITGGMLTHYTDKGGLEYEVFEPSEALAQKGILSLEEKFLAGEGQNITPARFSPDPELNRRISAKVRAELERAARILNVEGYCRIDAFVRVFEKDNVEVIFIEVNSLPGLTPATVIFHQAAINEYKPFEFLDSIIRFGVQRNKRRIKSEAKQV